MSEQIYELIPKIRAGVGVVRKDMQASGGARYSYRSADQVINALVPLLNEYGVFTTVRDWDHHLEERQSGNKIVTIATLTKEVTFWAPDGSHVSSIVAAENSDYSDKATGGASTYAYRYALLQTFTLPTDEDDPDAKYVEREAPAVVQPKPVPGSGKIVKLREEIKKAASERGMDGKQYMALGNSLFKGEDQKKWISDEASLNKLLAAINAGEVA